MTILGKILVVLNTFVSFAVLAVALWLMIDRHDWQKEQSALQQEIDQKKQDVNSAVAAFGKINDYINTGKHEVVLDYQKPNIKKTLKEARQMNDNLQMEIVQLNKQRENLVQQMDGLINDPNDGLLAEMQRTDAAQARQKEIRKTLSEVKTPTGETSVRKVIIELKTQTAKTNKAAEDLKPPLDIKQEMLKDLQNRHLQLERRRNELAKALQKSGG